MEENEMDKYYKSDVMGVFITDTNKENKQKYDSNKWKKDNPEKFKEVHKKNCEKYRKTHRAKMNEIESRYYYKHREEILKKAKEKYKKKKEQENK